MLKTAFGAAFVDKPRIVVQDRFVVRTKPKSDRRTRRTRRRLSGALVELIQEKRFNDITVQNVIERADVGRATFYKHFRDKEDLFDQQWQGLNRHLAERINWQKAGRDSFFPVTFFFQHLQDVQPFYRGLVRSGKIDELFNRGVAHLSRDIEAALREPARSRTGGIRATVGAPRLNSKRPETAIPISVLSNYLANEFFGLLRWWLDAGMPYPPAAMDNLFHRLINPTVKSAGLF